MIANLTFDSKGILVDELLAVSSNMKKSKDLRVKMFHYSAAYAICDRTMRLNYDKELLLIAVVLQASYNTIVERSQSLAHDSVIPIDLGDIDNLADLVQKLALAIRNNADHRQILERINEISFKTTGPGYYMHITGKIP